MPNATLIAESGEIRFWRVGTDVYRTTGSTAPDSYGLPMGRRFECSIAHWERFRELFAWAQDVSAA